MTGIPAKGPAARGEIEIGLYRIRMTPYGVPLWFLTLQLPNQARTRLVAIYGLEDVLAFTVDRCDGPFGHLGPLQQARIEGEQIARLPSEQYRTLHAAFAKVRPCENTAFVSRILNEFKLARLISSECCQRWTQAVQRPPRPIAFTSTQISQAALDEANLGQADLITLRQFHPWLAKNGVPTRNLTAVGLPPGRHPEVPYVDIARKADIVIKWITQPGNGPSRVPNRYCWETNHPAIRKLKDEMSSPFILSNVVVGRTDNQPQSHQPPHPSTGLNNPQPRPSPPRSTGPQPTLGPGPGPGTSVLASESMPDFADLFGTMLSLKDNPPKMSPLNPFEVGTPIPRNNRPERLNGQNSNPNVNPRQAPAGPGQGQGDSSAYVNGQRKSNKQSMMGNPQATGWGGSRGDGNTPSSHAHNGRERR